MSDYGGMRDVNGTPHSSEIKAVDYVKKYAKRGIEAIDHENLNVKV